jgi:uncharacterized protein YdeI (BOF family)
MRRALIAMMIALVAAPAYAQGIEGKQHRSKGKQAQSQTAEQKKKALEAEQAYKASLESIPNKASPDPWKNMR